jgi:hypothetical protein
VPFRRSAPWVVLAAIAVIAGSPFAQTPGPAVKDNNGDLELVKRLNEARKDYQKALQNLRLHYDKVGDIERKRWAEEELRQYQRIPQYAFILDLDVPHPKLQEKLTVTNVPEANKLLAWAQQYKDHGWGNDYIDNQRRAEILLQDLVSKYPHSNKISEAAYYLGDIYESKAYKQYRRAAAWYERCFQWNPSTHFDARLRAARLYDHEVKDRSRAIELYREITTHETDLKRLQEANKRLGELSAAPR